MRLYHYPGCATCKKAAKHLAGRDLDLVHLVEATPSVAVLADLWTRSGLPLRKLFNTSGQSYRAGGFGARIAEMSEAEMLAALAADGMLIKRPILDTGGEVLVGYDPARYERLP